MTFTLDFKELQERWMKLYMNLMVIKSKDPAIMTIIENFSLRLAEINQDMTEFFDEMENP